MNRLYKYFIFLFAFLVVVNFSFAQTDALKIVGIELNRDSCLLNIDIKLNISSGKYVDIEKLKKLEIYEEENGVRTPLQIAHILDLKQKTNNEQKQGGGSVSKKKKKLPPMVIYFSLDHSGSFDCESFEKAKKYIRDFCNKLPDSTIYFNTFDNQTHPSQLLTKSNFESIVGVLKSHGECNEGQNYLKYNTDLDNCVIQKLNELEKTPAKENTKRILVILTDGRNDLGDRPTNGTNEKYENSKSNVYDNLKTYKDISIYSIGLGNSIDEDFMKKLPDLTPDPNDGYSNSLTPEQLERVFDEIIVNLSADFSILCRPSNTVFEGIERLVALRLLDADQKLKLDDKFTYREGSAVSTIRCGKREETKTWLVFLIGIIFLIILFLLSLLIYPLIQNRMFNSRHVSVYKPLNRVQEDCFYCGTELSDGEKIVTKCEHRVHLDCWKANKHKCTNYPGQCKDGVQSRLTVHDFKNKTEESISIYWLLYGAVGGLLAWLLYTSLGNNFVWIKVVKSIYASVQGIQDISSFNSSQNDDVTVYYDLNIMGACMGLFLTLLFSIVEHKRKWTMPDYLKLAAKSIFGIVLGLLASTLGNYIFMLTDIPFISPLITWSIFGTLLGISLSLGSSILLRNGLLGGLLGAIIAFVVYYIVGQFGVIYKLLSWMMLGLIMGYIISKVVSMLENFCFIIESGPGKQIGQKLPIYKWLKIGMEIFMGGNPANHVTLHWEENIPDKLAILSYDSTKQETYIKITEGNDKISINGRLPELNKKYKLFDGDLLTIGQTKLRYSESRTTS